MGKLFSHVRSCLGDHRDRDRMVVGFTTTYMCNPCLSPLMLWVWVSIRARCTQHYVIKFCQWLATGRWNSLGHLISSTNTTDSHDITEILLKVALNTSKQTGVVYVPVAEISKWAGTWYFYLSEIVYSTGRNYWTPPKLTVVKTTSTIDLWNIFHKKLMITSIAEFSHSNRTTVFSHDQVDGIFPVLIITIP